MAVAVAAIGDDQQYAVGILRDPRQVTGRKRHGIVEFRAFLRLDVLHGLVQLFRIGGQVLLKYKMVIVGQDERLVIVCHVAKHVSKRPHYGPAAVTLC